MRVSPGIWRACRCKLTPLSGVLKVATATVLLCRRGGGDAVKLDGARLSCQGRYLPRVPHSSSSSFPRPPFLPFLYVWVSAGLPLSSILSSSPLTAYYYIGILLPCPPLLRLPWPAFTPVSSFPPPRLFPLLFSSFPKSFPFIIMLVFSSLSLSSTPPSLFSCFPSRSCEPQCLARMNGSYLSCWQVHPVCVFCVRVCVLPKRIRLWVLCVSTTWDVQILAQCHFGRFWSRLIGELL